MELFVSSLWSPVHASCHSDCFLFLPDCASLDDWKKIAQQNAQQSALFARIFILCPDPSFFA